MPISLLNNFDINVSTPIDSRIVVTNSSSRDSILYKYDGLTVFQTDTRQSWTWNSSSATWSYNVAGNGIYGGSGSLVGDTFVNFGSVNSTSGSTSSIFGYYSVASSNTVYLNNYLRRTAADSTYQSLSFRLQLLADSIPSSYIEFNPSYTDYGALAFGTNNIERLRINSNGKTGILMTAYGQASFMVNGIASSEGIYISPDNSNTAGVGGGYAILVDNTGSLKIRDTSPNSPDFVNLTTPGYQVINIIGGKMLVGGTSSTAATVTIPDSRLDIFETTGLGTTNGNNLILRTLTHNQAGSSSGNLVRVREWAVRNTEFSSTTNWTSWRYHNGISIDSSYGLPTTSRTFWERDPNREIQWLGSSNKKNLQIDSLNSKLSFSDGTTTKFLFDASSGNSEKITYLDSNTYVIEGVYTANWSSGVSYAPGTDTTFIKNIAIPNSCVVTVEAVFNSVISRGSYSIFTTSISGFSSHNKLTTNLRFFGGSPTLRGSVTDYSYTESTLSAGTIAYSTNVIGFYQPWTAFWSGSYYTNAYLSVSYKIHITQYV